jgi:UDP-N-acetylmuramyl pentapeptide synthase
VARARGSNARRTRLAGRRNRRARYAGGAALAIAAPRERLLAATELNEWAWQGAALAVLGLPLPFAPGHPATLDFDSARETLRLLAAAEARPRLDALVAEAERRGLPVFEDDEFVTIGAGKFSRTWSLDEITRTTAAIDLSKLAPVPAAVVTGSNGKTTTVRLLAAMCAEAGRAAGYNCTDGVWVGGERLEQGDWSGPAGARRVLRDARVETAILETARGGLLRRGLAVAHADAAIVTNVSADHFGEYGIHSLAELAQAKLVVARALGGDGLLVLNADDAELVAASAGLRCRTGWFSLDAGNPFLAAARAAGAPTCAAREGRLWLHTAEGESDLGLVAAMPLTLGGVAQYNLANAAGAALVAQALGIAPMHIAAVLARFGARNSDNPGRLQRWRRDGVEVLLDYAHNPDGLQGLLAMARALAPRGRLGLLLGQAGNREDEAIRALARTAAAGGAGTGGLEGPAQLPARARPGEFRRCCWRTAPRLASMKPAAGGAVESEAARSLLSWRRPGTCWCCRSRRGSARAAGWRGWIRPRRQAERRYAVTLSPAFSRRVGVQ